MEKNHICRECNQKFDSHSQKINHIRWTHRDNSNYFKRFSESCSKREARRYGNFIIADAICQNCGQSFKRKIRESKNLPRFCCRSCANYRVHSELTKQKIAIGVSEKWKHDANYAQKCSLSNQQVRKRFSSKDERELRSKFQEKFPNDEWTFGGRIIYNGLSIVRDLYSNKLKVSIEYDGIWHFKDIHGQLKEKQEKDLALEMWCKQNNWRLIRIRDNVYLQDKNFWFDRLIEEVQNGTERVQKFYDSSIHDIHDSPFLVSGLSFRNRTSP